jgi:DNA-binding transcriptional LysR family regulator
MTLSQLRYFQAVCNHGNISKASEFMHVSQPAVSIAINNLETEFGVALFLRENKRLVLTDAGHFLLSRVNELLSDADALYAQMANFDKDKHSLKVSVVPLGVLNNFSTVFERFRKAHPEVEITVSESSAQKAVLGIKNGNYNLAMTVALPEMPDFIDGLLLYKTPSVFCVGKNHPMASWKKCTFSDLISQSLIFSNYDSYLTTEVRKRFRELGVTPKVSLYSVQSSLISEVLSTCRDGAFLTERAAAKIPDIIAIPIEDPIVITRVLIWKRCSFLSPSIAKFISLIKQQYPDAVALCACGT